MPENNRPQLLSKLAEGPLTTRFGEFTIAAYHDGLEEAIVLSFGKLEGATDVLCRIHSECITAHVFHGYECDCYQQMEESQQLIQADGKGIIIFLRQEGRGNGAAAHIATLPLKRDGMLQHDAYKELGVPEDRRSFAIAAQIIRHLGVSSVQLISANSKKRTQLQQLGIKVNKRMIHYSGSIVYLGRRATDLVANIKAKIAESPLKHTFHRSRILIIGDLNIDFVLTPDVIQQPGRIVDKTPPLVGGTAYGAARAFKNARTHIPIIFGGIGDDSHGKRILKQLKEDRFPSLIRVHDELTQKSKDGKYDSLPTGTCTLFYFPHDERGTGQDRSIFQDPVSANTYDLEDLSQAIDIMQLNSKDAVLLVAHAFARFGEGYGKSIIDKLHPSGAKIILDIVPHDMYLRVNSDKFRSAIREGLSGLIGEYNTLRQLTGLMPTADDPDEQSLGQIAHYFRIPFIELRHGEGNISKRTIVQFTHSSNNYITVKSSESTGYDSLPADQRRGFGDRLTKKFVQFVTSN